MAGTMLTTKHVEALLAAWDAARIGNLQRAQQSGSGSASTQSNTKTTR